MSAPAAVVLNVDCAFLENPGYDYEEQRIREAGATLRLQRARGEDEIIEAARDAEIILLERGETPITARVIEHLPACRAFVKYGIGLDNIDIAAATRQGIVVANAAEFCVEEVSDHAIALMLAAARRIVAMDRNIRAGGWFDFPQRDSLRRISSLTLGLLGFGRIARSVARKLSGFGMRMLMCDPYADPSSLPVYVNRVEREQLLRQSDLLSIHLPLTAETRGMISDAEIATMKPSAIIINTGRGPVVDEPALVRALRENRIAAAALDVFTEEPLPESSPLQQFSNVVMTPHFAAQSRESILDLHRSVADSVVALLRGHWPQFPANPEVTPRVPLAPWIDLAALVRRQA